MRLSTITSFVAEGDAAFTTQIVYGSAPHVSLTFTDSTGTATNLTGYTFEFDTNLATGTITPSTSNTDEYTLSNLVLDSSSAVSRDALVSITSASTGEVDLYLPSQTLLSTAPAFDTNTSSTLVVGTLRYSNAASTEKEITSLNVVLVMRFGVVAT